MLNGKFFTGLPPGMIERRTGPAKNRLESHLFWPDESHQEPASEPRQRRRTSLQTEPPKLTRMQPQLSVDETGMDTKQMFHKEFAKSSIHFCDNLQDGEGHGRQQTSRRHLNARQGVTPKPTATKLELPDSVVDERYTRAKKQQVYASKIEFYDYPEDDLYKRNNNLRAKADMNMNDKKEVARHTKNSPKLQVKGNVKNLNTSERKNNDDVYLRDAYTPERGLENDFEKRVRGADKVIRNPVFADRRNRDDYAEGHRRSSPGGYVYENEVEAPRVRRDYRSDERDGDGRYDNRYREESPRRILKNSRRDADEDYYASKGANFNDDTHLAQKMHNARLRSSPQKHVSYRDERYEDDGPGSRFHYESAEGSSSGRYRDRERERDRARGRGRTDRSTTPNMRTGSNQRQQRRAASPDPHYEHEATESQFRYKAIGRHDAIKSVNNNKINNSSNWNNNNKRPPESAQVRQSSPNSSTATTTVAHATSSGDTDAEPPPADMQKHLRSSLCFHDGEIVAGIGASATKTPTDGDYRRNARNSAASQRVSVGLPG